MGSDKKISDTVTDIDGNKYKTIKIGTQWWMAENLKVTHYRNGDPLNKVVTNIFYLDTGAYCAYEYKDSLSNIYGYLYNWAAVADTRNLAPEGWHVPITKEWETLVYFLGGGLASAKLKESGTSHWSSPNTDATNESGFTALGAGVRGFTNYGNPFGFYYGNPFSYLGKEACFWSREELYDPIAANYFSLTNLNYSLQFGTTERLLCMSVRLVMD